MKVFKLKYADAQETADLLSNLYPDETTQNNNQNNRSFGMRFMPPWMQQPAATPGKSERMTRQTLVRAVPDLRTASVVVTASKDQMEQITQMIESLDSNPAMVQKVFAFPIDRADPVTVQAALTALFAGPNTKTSTSSTTSSPDPARHQLWPSSKPPPRLVLAHRDLRHTGHSLIRAHSVNCKIL